MLFSKKILVVMICIMSMVASPALANGHGGRGDNGRNYGYGHHGGGYHNNNWQVPAIIGGTILGLGVTSMILSNREAPVNNYYVAPAPVYVPAPSYYVAPSCRSFTQTTYTPEGYAYYVTREMCVGTDGVWRVIR
jgi:hypothetical protein